MTTPTKDTQDYTRLGNLSPEYLLRQDQERRKLERTSASADRGAS